ncbi:site-specific DNA-methyltransferase [Mycobacteroides chelonae]|nr:site-specific DNA-methyltransferase [Mycobacteroides chelonae]
MTAPYYQDDSVTLYHGDCLDVLPTLDGAAVVITDPPYSEHTHTSVRSRKMVESDRGARYGADVRRVVDLGFEPLSEELRAFCAEQFARIAARWVLVFSDVESDHLWRNDLVENGLDYVRTGAWIKLGSTPQFSGDRPATGFEAITICHPKGRKRWNGGGRHAVWSVPIVLDRGRTGARLHTTQKPDSLIRSLVDLFSEPGEVVLDPFAGSGTTLVAATYLGRKSVGVEREEKYCEIIANRLAQGVLDFEEGA